ncbi:hypothetical protein [Allohahella marinimesophila]|uniref:Uncharacterized protein n=1 Tax=Allohahella marinimesophila TaxID=1054972 RepID=A0ABP7NGP1_9GAMM
MYNAVNEGILDGKTLQADIRLPRYSQLSIYDEWLPLNVAGVHRIVMNESYLDRRPDLSK